jgi:hypothetical protein
MTKCSARRVAQQAKVSVASASRQMKLLIRLTTNITVRFASSCPYLTFSIMRVILLPQCFLPQSAVKVGRFAANVDETRRDYYDPTPGLGHNVVEKIETNYDGADTHGGHSNFASTLTSFLASSLSSHTKASIRIRTE